MIKSRTIKINPVSHNSPVYYKHPSEDHDAVKSQTSGRVEEFWSDQMEEGGKGRRRSSRNRPLGLGPGILAGTCVALRTTLKENCRARGPSPHQMGSQIQTNNNCGRRKNAHPMTERRLSIERVVLLFTLLGQKWIWHSDGRDRYDEPVQYRIVRCLSPTGFHHIFKVFPFDLRAEHVPVVVSSWKRTSITLAETKPWVDAERTRQAQS